MTIAILRSESSVQERETANRSRLRTYRAKEMRLDPIARSCGRVVPSIRAHRNRRTDFGDDS